MDNQNTFRRCVEAIMLGDVSMLLLFLEQDPSLANTIGELEGHHASLLDYVAATACTILFNKHP